jgi:hypothetical protein
MARRGATADPTAAELAQARERDRKAVELALAGASYTAIADQLGYADRSGAWKAVRRALDRQEATEVGALREQEVARLDRMQAALWAKALRGDVQAVAAVLRIIDRRCKLQGLDLPARVHVQADVSGSIDVSDPAARLAAVRELTSRTRPRLEQPAGD